MNVKLIGISQAEKEELQLKEKEYWQNIAYGDAVNIEIRARYSASQEFAILRQKDEKPEEYMTYYAYCEQCKSYVKAQKEKYK